LPPFSYQASALQALHSTKDQLQSEKDACEHRIMDLKYLLDKKASDLSQYSEKIAAMTDTLQRNEKRFSELEIENKSLEGELRAQRTAFDRVQTDLNALELKLRDSLSKVSDLYAEVEMKTASGLELKAVSCK
jgi:chromosome segregation ATPase